MNSKRITTLGHIMFAFFMMLVMASCGGGEDKVGSESMISGASSKTWTADKELTSTGEKDQLTQEEQDETMQFYSDGRFALGGGGTLQTGTWSFDQAAKRLTLNFENQEMAENFEVTKLTDDEMNLRTPDGAEMRMKAK